MIVVFLAMAGSWCAVGGQLIHHYGHRVLPFVLIALGLIILLAG